MRRRETGFTLVELLVVIAVIAVLAGISIPVIASVKTRQKATSTKLLIDRLKTALEHYAQDFGDYPPSSARLAGLSSNGVNDGIECLVRCLSTKRKSGPYFQFEDESLRNTDEDRNARGNPTGSYMETTELFEVVDAFGNPLLYLHNADYDRGGKVRLGEESPAFTGVKSKKTGQYHGLQSFQLWSVGANGKNDQGEDDDLTSWSGSE